MRDRNVYKMMDLDFISNEEVQRAAYLPEQLAQPCRTEDAVSASGLGEIR